MANPDPQLSQRALKILHYLVELYTQTGQPVGSRVLSKKFDPALSPATIRNVMADLEEAGLLFAPHTSAGRLPTPAGLKLIIEEVMEMGPLTPEELSPLEATNVEWGQNLPSLLDDISSQLASLAGCASIVMVPKTEAVVAKIECVPLSSQRCMVIIITEEGMVENRIIHLSPDMSPDKLKSLIAFLSERVAGKTLAQTYHLLTQEIAQEQKNLETLLQAMTRGLEHPHGTQNQLIIRGKAHLLDSVKDVDELTQLRRLFEVIDTHEGLMGLMDAIIHADGVQIFIGSHNPLFTMTGCSAIVAPYGNRRGQPIGAVGVIGPSYMNYGRLIPMVNYTARLVERILKERSC